MKAMRLPAVFTKTWHALCRISDWLDNNVFTAEEDIKRWEQLMQREDARVELMVESDGNKIRKRIAECRTLEECYQVRPLLDKYRSEYGNTPQVRAMEGSLRLDLFHRENDIIEALPTSYVTTKQ